MRNTESTFWSKVNILSDKECWEWTGCKISKGYGTINYDGKRRLAHRLAYHFSKGFDLDSADFICHSCDNPPCCNPSHLWLGNALSNTRDMIEKGRAKSIGSIYAKRTHCARGHLLEGKNIYHNYPSRKRVCRICAIARAKVGKEKRKRRLLVLKQLGDGE